MAIAIERHEHALMSPGWIVCRVCVTVPRPRTFGRTTIFSSIATRPPNAVDGRKSTATIPTTVSPSRKTNTCPTSGRPWMDRSPADCRSTSGRNSASWANKMPSNSHRAGRSSSDAGLTFIIGSSGLTPRAPSPHRHRRTSCSRASIRCEIDVARIRLPKNRSPYTICRDRGESLEAFPGGITRPMVAVMACRLNG